MRYKFMGIIMGVGILILSTGAKIVLRIKWKRNYIKSSLYSRKKKKAIRTNIIKDFRMMGFCNQEIKKLLKSK